MGYHIINMDFNNLLANLRYKNKDGEIKISDFDIKIDVRRSVSKSGYRIEELDYFTSQCKNENEFYNALVSNNYIDISKSKTKSIVISHIKQSGKIVNDDIIYDDELVTKTALDIIAKKLRKSKYKTSDKIMVNDSEEVLQFIEYIKNLALDKESRKYLIGPYPHYFDENDKLIDLEEMISKDFYNSDKLCVEGLNSLLKKFVLYTNSYQESVMNNEDTIEAKSNLDRINKKIDKTIREKYLAFRNLIVWENRYEQVLKKEFEQEQNPKKKNIMAVLLEEVKLQRNYRNGKIDKCVLETFYSEKRDRMDYESSDENVGSFKNEEMERLYREGGIENVMINMDTDILYGNQDNLDDMEVLTKLERTSGDKNSERNKK